MKLLRALMPHWENTNPMRSCFDRLPFIRIIGDYAKLDIVCAMSLNDGMRDGLQESCLAGACISGNKHRSRMRIMQIEQNR